MQASTTGPLELGSVQNHHFIAVFVERGRLTRVQFEVDPSCESTWTSRNLRGPDARGESLVGAAVADAISALDAITSPGDCRSIADRGLMNDVESALDVSYWAEGWTSGVMVDRRPLAASSGACESLSVSDPNPVLISDGGQIRDNDARRNAEDQIQQFRHLFLIGHSSSFSDSLTRQGPTHDDHPLTIG